MRSKLTSEQKESLLKDKASGEYSNEQLSKKYGISYVYTCFLIRRSSQPAEEEVPESEVAIQIKDAIRKLEDKKELLQDQISQIDTQIKQWETALKAAAQPQERQ